METYIGYRKWRLFKRPRAGWTVGSLYSKSIWKPGTNMVAWCNKTQSHELCPHRIGHHHCGMWVCRTVADMEKQQEPDYYMVGKAELTNGIIQEYWGARAKECRILEFWLLSKFEYPDELVQYLETFGVPIKKNVDFVCEGGPVAQ